MCLNTSVHQMLFKPYMQIAYFRLSKSLLFAESSQADEPSSDGWASWAWSYVPDILYYEDDEDGAGSTRRREKRPDPILSVGLYCDRAQITFKVGLTQNAISEKSL